MKIAVIILTRGGVSGGLRQYLKNIIPRMAKCEQVESLLCVAPQSIYIQDWIEKLPHVDFANCRPFRPFHYNPDPVLHAQLKTFSPDVIFIPVERYFKYEGVPVVNMIQNMGPLLFSDRNNPLTETVRNWIQSIETKISVKKANQIIAVSHFVRDFVIDTWSVSQDRIKVIYYGSNYPEDNNINSNKPDLAPENWKGNFIFTAGSILPLRGLEDLLTAMKYLLSLNNEISGLVIAGEAPRNMISYQKKLKNWLKTNGLSTRIVWTGHLNKNEMLWCYNNCRAFIMTSRVESFGNIALEAMSHGCISIASNNPCLPEIFGNTAFYYPPKNWRALSKEIQTVMEWDINQRNKASESAKKRAAMFSWDVTVEKTVATLERAIDNY